MGEGNSAIAERIRVQIATNDVVLYMRGTPVFPQCGPSAQAAQILGFLGVPFTSLDVLEDPGLKEGLKTFSDWPTIPQLYVKGQFVGGVDILQALGASGELEALFRDQGLLPPAA